MKHIIWLAGLYFSSSLLAADGIPDSASSIGLNEVVVVEKKPLNHLIQTKPLSSLDEYLEQASKISLVKRGNYAWEPMINNMSTERISVTIDGMHIFGACTDKMDPVTSYVDVSNLSDITVCSGQQGASYGPTIGGSINLSRKKPDFCHTGWGLAFDAGFESNALLQTYGAAAHYIHQNFFVNIDFMYRDAENYTAGKKEKVLYSQFTKYNLSGMLGVRLNDRNRIIGSFIFDRAKDIGYPALPMDVSLAQAQIASVEHIYEKPGAFLNRWESKVYFNTINHQMDDTKRPDVPMHMDMPGWSKTYGLYSKLSASKENHRFTLNINSYYNQSLADMTMYPENPEEPAMYMYTWPDVRTQYSGLQLEHVMTWKTYHQLRYSAGLGWHRNMVANETGLNSLQIFYPGMNDKMNRFLPATAISYLYDRHYLELETGLGYGERAPSVSEGYGYYLFNSFDRFDYIGNPDLKNERSLEMNARLKWKKEKFFLQISSSYFRQFNYIIGVPDPDISVMTLGANGVKIYTALQAASIYTSECSAEYRPHTSLKLRASLSYNLGRDDQGENLPLIRPFSFTFGVAYKYRAFDAELTVEGAAKQSAFSAGYGEDLTPAYAVLNFSAGYMLLKNSHRVYFRTGIENIANTRYSTFSDWNNIPAKGINFFFHISYLFDRKKPAQKNDQPVVKAG